MFPWSPGDKTYLVDVNKISTKYITQANIEAVEGFFLNVIHCNVTPDIFVFNFLNIQNWSYNDSQSCQNSH